MKELRPGGTRLRLHGDKDRAQGLRVFAMRKLQGFLATCNEDQEVCGPWKVEFSDGSWIKLSQLYDQPVIDIFVPEIIKAEREVPVSVPEKRPEIGDQLPEIVHDMKLMPAFKVVNEEDKFIGLLVCKKGKFGPPYFWLPLREDQEDDIPGFSMSGVPGAHPEKFYSCAEVPKKGEKLVEYIQDHHGYDFSHEWTSDVELFDEEYCTEKHVGVSKRSAKRLTTRKTDVSLRISEDNIIYWEGLRIEHSTIDWIVVGATATLNAGYGLPIPPYINELDEEQQERLSKIMQFAARSLWAEGGAPNISPIAVTAGGHWYSSRSEVSNLDPMFGFEWDDEKEEWVHSAGFFPWDVSYLQEWNNQGVDLRHNSSILTPEQEPENKRGSVVFQWNRMWGKRTHSTPDECKYAPAYCPYGANPLDIGLPDGAGTETTSGGEYGAKLNAFETEYSLFEYGPTEQAEKDIWRSWIEAYLGYITLLSLYQDIWGGANKIAIEFTYYSLFGPESGQINDQGHLVEDIAFRVPDPDDYKHSLGVTVKTLDGEETEAYCEGEFVLIISTIDELTVTQMV